MSTAPPTAAPSASECTANAATNPPGDIPAVTQLCREAAGRLGWTVEVLDHEFGYLVEVNNGSRSRVLFGGRSPLNDALVARLTEDKYFTTLLLARKGFRVPPTARCVSPTFFDNALVNRRAGVEPGVRFAAEHGLPVVVKPNSLSHGRGVTIIWDSGALTSTIEATWRLDPIAIVQAYVPGADVRLDYLDGDYLVGYQRSRHGTGGEVLNLARGARPTVLDDVPPAWHTLCLRIGSLIGLRHFGVDLRVDGRGEPTVIEVNASPLLTRLFELGHAERAIAGTIRVLRAVFDLPAVGTIPT